MLKLINCRLLDGSLSTIYCNNSKIERVETQEQELTAVGDVVSIKELGGFSDWRELQTVDANSELIIPGLVDVHVHSRDPGHTQKECWDTLKMAAYKGGVVAVADMPNTNPPTISLQSIEKKQEVAAKSGLDYRFFLGINDNNISKLKEILAHKELPLAGLKIYYGKSTGDLLFNRLDLLRQNIPEDFDLPIVFHAEDQATIDENMASLGEISACEKSQDFIIHSNIRSSKSAHTATRDILDWYEKTSMNLRIHFAHISTPYEVELIEKAKERCDKITLEVAPHHLFFNDKDYEVLGSLIKVNPPVRSKKEMDDLQSLFGKGKFDFFATDHAPHTLEEKAKNNYRSCPSGMPSIEHFTPALLTMAKQVNLPLSGVESLAGKKAANLFGFNKIGSIEPGYDANFVWIKEKKCKGSDQPVLSKCGWTPYKNTEFSFEVQATWHKGAKVYSLA